MSKRKNIFLAGDWAKELLKFSVIQSYDFAMRGGALNVLYAASAGYFDQTGIIENSL